MLAHSGGRVPVRLFEETSMFMRWVMLDHAAGRDPVKRFE